VQHPHERSVFDLARLTQTGWLPQKNRLKIAAYFRFFSLKQSHVKLSQFFGSLYQACINRGKTRATLQSVSLFRKLLHKSYHLYHTGFFNENQTVPKTTNSRQKYCISIGYFNTDTLI
jgi:hypothetical protein